ncbi:MAG: HlyD family efflux transporter periplasmic adaptor subunit [Butyricicoccus pullicaecorum]|nr:HlyD family efflux transporter periplasmic adaptor subunit [Butyricicoccus pullicaecorum]
MPTLDKTPVEHTPDSADTQSTAPVPEAVTEGSPDPAPPNLVRNRYADTMNKPRRRLPKPVRIVLWIVLLAAILGGGIYLVQKSRQTTETSSIKTATAERGFLETYVEGDGRTAAKTRSELGKDIKGKVLKVNVATGDTVKAGQVILTIDPTETRKELETAQTALNEAQKGISDANKTLSNLVITAPFTGRLLPPGEVTGSETDTAPSSEESTPPPSGSTQEVKIQAGDEVASGTTLGTLVDDTNMHLDLYYSYAYIDQLKVGAEAVISIPQTMGTVSGKVDKIERIEKISDEGSRLFRATITFRNPGTLKAGMAATATVTAGGLNIAPTESGKLAYSREIQIVTKAAGKANAACAPSYQKFSAGQTILRLTSEEATNALTTAQQLVKTRQETVNDLTKRIQECTVTSPIDGIVMSLDAVEGEDLSGNTIPCVVADTDNIVINADISMSDVAHVQVGQTASITMDLGNESISFTGTVQSVALEASKNESNSQGAMPTFPAVISVDPIEGQTLRPDFYVNYRITTAQSEDCITVPSSAVVNTADGVAVFVQPAEGQTFENALPLPEGSDVPEGFVLVPIETGLADAENTEVLSGIEEGTTVLLAGPQDLYNMEQEGDSAGGTAVSVAVG